MPGTEDLRDFVEELLLNYDPDIDLSEGAPAQLEIVDKLVERFTPDPFEMDMKTFIRTRLRQEYPDLNIDEADALTDFLVKPAEVLLEPIIREVTLLRNNKSMASPELLAAAEADALGANQFVARDRGDYATGQVRIYFSGPTAMTVSVGNVATTADGLNFVPTTAQTITAEAMLFNQDGNLYYFDVSYQAESPGDDYNIEPGQIVTIANMPAAVKVTNLSRFRDGSPEESTVGYIERVRSSITERSLVSGRGANALLLDQFSALRHLQTVGFKDPEMLRDVLKGGGLGDVLTYRTDGQTSDDGDGDGYASIFESPTGGFTSLLGPVGASTSYVLTVAGTDYAINYIYSDDAVGIEQLDGTRAELSDNLSAVPFYIRKKSLTLSSIPGGITNANGPRGTVEINDDEVHVGGAADFYVRGLDLEEQEITIESINDEEPVTSGLDLETRPSGYPNDIVRTDPAGTTDFKTLDVQTGQTLVIETGGDANSYQILKVNPNGLGVNYLQVYPEPTSPATGLKYRIVDTIDINLGEPRTTRGSGSDLKTVLGSLQVSTVSEVDFDALGVEPGDTLRISGETVNAGDRTIIGVTGTGNKILQLSEMLKRTSSSESWTVVKLQTGVETPVVRIKQVDLLDSANQETGDIIPLADPIDIRSSSFSNIGVGEKLAVANAITGILGTVDLSSAPGAVNGTTVRISVNNSTAIPITFSGVTSAQDIIDQINAGLPGFNLAGLVDVQGESRLSLRSRNNWIRVLTTSTANTALGLSTSYEEDNRQVTSATVSDWTAEELTVERDSVYILSGDNTEFWYLQAIEAERLLIVRVDDGGKAVFPLTDAAVTVRVGSRSLGKVRCYFLNPTSFEVRGAYHKARLNTTDHAANIVLGTLAEDETARTEFTLDVFGDGSAEMQFFPDPELEHTAIPASDDDPPANLEVTSGTNTVDSTSSPASGPGQYSRDAAIDFVRQEVLAGDILEITYQPLQGSKDIRPAPTGIPTYPTDVVGKTLVFSLENGPDRTVTFTNDVDGPDRLVQEINEQVGEEIAFVEDTGTDKYLRIECDFALALKSSSTVIAGSDPLGMAAQVGTNTAAAAGEYVIETVGTISGATAYRSRLVLGSKVGDATWSAFTAGQVGPAQHFMIKRPGVQRISATEMADQTEGTLYYADVELISYGPGDEFNISPDLQLEVTRHQSDGYRVTNSDENLAFSEDEELQMQLSRRMLTVGSTDLPENMTQLSKQNIQVTYERSPLVAQVQSFADSDQDRVLTANILAKHLTPHFVRMAIEYEGGSSTAVVQTDIEEYIEATEPEELLEASAISDIIRRRGATRVVLPIVLIGVVHRSDRRVIAERSEDAISRGRLSTFIADVIDLSRET